MTTSTKLDPIVSGDSGKGLTEFEASAEGIRVGRLIFSKGSAPNITLEGDSNVNELFHARFERPVPDLYVDGGTVNIEYPHPLRSQEYAPGRVALNTAVSWSIAVHGGISEFEARLERIRLNGLEITGGLSDVLITLPEPWETVEIRITGGVSRLMMKRPRGVPMRVVVTGSVADLKLDDNYFSAVGGETIWESIDYKRATDRYSISITGGVSTAIIQTA